MMERRRKPVAELRPVSAFRRMPARKKARIFARMEKLWARMPLLDDSSKCIEEDRPLISDPGVARLLIK